MWKCLTFSRNSNTLVAFILYIVSDRKRREGDSEEWIIPKPATEDQIRPFIIPWLPRALRLWLKPRQLGGPLLALSWAHQYLDLECPDSKCCVFSLLLWYREVGKEVAKEIQGTFIGLGPSCRPKCLGLAVGNPSLFREESFPKILGLVFLAHQFPSLQTLYGNCHSMLLSIKIFFKLGLAVSALEGKPGYSLRKTVRGYPSPQYLQHHKNSNSHPLPSLLCWVFLTSLWIGVISPIL